MADGIAPPVPYCQMRLAVTWIACVALACAGSRAADEPYVKRRVAADDIHGTWAVVGEHEDLSELNGVQGLGPLSLSGKAIVLRPDGTCDVSVTDPGSSTGSTRESPNDSQAGRMRHPTDVCLWNVGNAFRKGPRGEEQVAAAHVTVTRAGYLRGMSFFIAEKDGHLRLWAERDATGAAPALELRR